MSRLLLSLSLIALAGCRTEKATDDTGATTADVDADGDGYLSGEDCDDADPSTNPGATEVCDGVDNDCDDAIDEEVLGTFYADADEDGYGDPDAVTEACDTPPGHVPTATDCDDADPDAYPSAPERCNGVDDDCDGEVDEDALDTWYADADDDGYGDADSPFDSCDPPAGYVADATDCDDTSAAARPDGTEICDERDNDCDGDVDEDVTTTFFQDADGDGWGRTDVTTEACAPDDGYSRLGGDCDDAETGINPSATEVCDGVDNDCDGNTDEDSAADASTWYSDADSDGYGDPTSTTQACAQPAFFVADDTDCDDGEAAVNPAATEVCDSVDNDCDGAVDEDDAADATTWYGDADGDGYGGMTFQVTSCTQPSDYVADSTDCNDLSADTYPGAPEVCDDDDNDCDGTTDEGVGSTWYADTDGDGYGDAASTSTDCEQPTGYVTDDTDCDDTDAAAYTGAAEICDGVDNDCNGTVDDDADTLGTDAACAADTCLDILTADPTASDGAYWLDLDGAGDIAEAWCEMDVDGGGWLAVFNYMDPQSSTYTDAANFHAALIVNDDMLDPVEPDETSSAIETANVDLSAYTEVMYGWAPSDVDDVSRYASYVDSAGLTGECYVDGYCGGGVTIATMTVVPTGSVRAFQTGNVPTYPHVGMGWSSQIITWGYDRNTSSYGNWANWYDTKSCCTAGATADMLTPGWRYTVYIR